MRECITHYACDCIMKENETLKRELSEQERINRVGSINEAKLMAEIQRLGMVICERSDKLMCRQRELEALEQVANAARLVQSMKAEDCDISAVWDQFDQVLSNLDAVRGITRS